jgi:hypothetical protein
MKVRERLVVGWLIGAGLMPLACASGAADPGDPRAGGAGEGGGGEGGRARAARTEGKCPWPAGTYGASVGDIVSPDLSWQGYAEGTNELGPISIHDYFDCDGSRGDNALLVLQSASWCGACRAEAADMRAEVARWSGKGIRVLTLLIQDGLGKAATPFTALSWKSSFGLDSVAVAADPSFSFAPTGGRIGLPMSILIDPRTMKIVSVEAGFSGDFSAVERLARKNAE